jgi:Carboxypeptidase regulatory-like domain/TonB-dependent Receptor Plug Domain
MRIRQLISAAVLLIALCCMSVFAQALRGRVEGTVKDPQGQLLPNATVSVKNTGTGETLTATTTGEGSFVVNELKPGTYSITTEASGFKRSLITGIIVQVATVTTVQVELEVGTVNEEVTISADDAQVVINSSNPEVGEVVDRQKILELPLDGRNPFELTALQAGVQTKSSGDGEVTRFSINGNRTVANNLTVDGVNASDNFLKTPANVTLSVIPVSVESIAEFRVTSSLPSAEFGRGSAQINAVTASGTNNFRGSIFEFHRNTAFNANNFFNNSTVLENGENVPREPLIRNQFGGRLGGRIVRDKTFFFASYEGKRESRGLSRNRLVYTQPARQGIFRYLKGRATTPANVAIAPGTPAPATIITGIPAGTVTCATTGATALPTGTICVQNVLGINASRTAANINPTMTAYLGLTPLPNNFQIGDGLNTGGFRFNSKVLSPTDQFSLRLDHRFNDKHSFEATYNYGDILFNGDYINEREPAFPDSTFGTRQTIGRGTSGTFRSIITPTVINEARVGAQISGLTFGNTADYSRGYILDIANVFNPEYSNIGTGRSLRVVQFADNLTILRGDHSFKVGAEVRNLWVRRYSLTGTLPVLDFSNSNDPGFATSSFPGVTPSSVTFPETLANTITGAVATVTQVFNVVNPTDRAVVRGAAEVREYANWETSVYAQDSWRFRPNLTLNLGLRYELYGAPKEANNLGLLPVGGSAGLYGVSGDGNLFQPGVMTGSAPVLDFAPDGVFYNSDKNNFAPVFGFAWDPFKKGTTSIRGGYRISYFQGTINAVDATLDDNEGLIITTTRTVNTFLSNGIGETPLPTVSIPAPQSIQTNSTVDIRAFDENLRTPYVHDFNFGIQREIFKGTSLEIRYVGNRGKKLYRGYDVNQVNVFARDTVTGQTFLDAFRIGQTNLAACRATPSCTTLSFQYNAAIPGSLPNPLMDVLFTGQTSSYSLSNFTQRVEEGRAGDFIDYLLRLRILNNVRGGSFLNAVAAGRLPLNFLRANPAVRGAQFFTNGSTSAYDSLQIELTRRLTGGLRFQASYVFAKGLSDFTGSTGDTNSFLTLLDTRREYAQYTNTHQFLANAIYQLPFGRGRKYLRSVRGVTGALVSGWQVSGIAKFNTGDPLSLLSRRGTINRDGLSGSNTVDVAGGLTTEQIQALTGIRNTPNGIYFIDPDLAPGSTSDANKVVFLNPRAGTVGALGLSSVFGPRFFNFDFSVLKRTRISENKNLEFRAEIFNAFNTVNFDNPTTDINSVDFGRITSIVGRPRLMQLGLRLNF